MGVGNNSLLSRPPPGDTETNKGASQWHADFSKLPRASSREGCCLTSSPGLSFPASKMGVAWWLRRTAALGLVITVTKPSWTVGRESQLWSLHRPPLM